MPVPPRAAVATVLVLTALAVIAGWPTPTSVGVDYKLTTRSVPLYQKAIAFVDRDIQLRAVADAAGAGAVSEEDRAMRLLRWVHDNVRPQPSGFPVVDDHILNIVVRGYGKADQAADVFATLAAYNGIPATLAFPRRPDGTPVYAFAYAFVNGDWRVFDVRGGFPLRYPDGTLASLDRLRREPDIVRDLVSPAEAGGASYPEIVALLPDASERLRGNDQMPLGRLWQELTRLVRGR